jgi:oxygen-independent coproporphyrinogen-3 oxidase
MATLYLHIPFCKRICPYCDFYKVGATELLPSVVEMMHREMEQRAEFLPSKNITSIYFGGGTPSLLQPKDIERLIDKARTLFDCRNVGEITIEANPDDLTPNYISELRTTSVNCISLGIQSFDDAVLGFMKRRHNAQGAIDAIERLRKAGYDNISIDLIFGITGFGNDHLRHSLQRAIELEAEHISAYHLTIEERTRLAIMVRKAEYTPIDEEGSEREYLLVHDTLTKAGYDHYEVSNYARNNRYAQHNSAYWQGVDYLGIGAGAHSFATDTRTWCSSTAKEYSQGVFLYQSEELTERDHLNEYVMTSLRTTRGIDIHYLSTRFGNSALQNIMHAAEPWLQSGTLRNIEGRLFIPAEKFLLSDAVIESLFA